MWTVMGNIGVGGWFCIWSSIQWNALVLVVTYKTVSHRDNLRRKEDRIGLLHEAAVFFFKR